MLIFPFRVSPRGYRSRETTMRTSFSDRGVLIFFSIELSEVSGQQSSVQWAFPVAPIVGWLSSWVSIDSISHWWWLIDTSTYPAKTIPQLGRVMRSVRMRERRYFIWVMVVWRSSMFFRNLAYFLVATSQVRTNSSIKSSFSFHSLERAFVPQQERWFLRSSRLALCNNPIDALIWWATSAQYTLSSIIFWTLVSVPIAFLILSWILSFDTIIILCI